VDKLDDINGLLDSIGAPEHEHKHEYDVAIIDGGGIVHPCFAIVRKDDALPDDALIREVCSLFWGTVDPYLDDGAECVIAWDPKDNRDYRAAILPCYKHGRGARDPLLRGSMIEIFKQARAKGYRQVIVPGYEADDAIASLVREMRATRRVLIVSEDRDLHQLVGDNVRQAHPRAGITCDEAVIETRSEHSAEDHTARKAIKGDTGDNVRGLPGVGEKKADAILVVYPDFVDDCQGGVVEWNRLPADLLKALIGAGQLMVHPVRSKADKRVCREVDALVVVRDAVRETYRLVALEDGLGV